MISVLFFVYQRLFSSETSFGLLRYYQPKQRILPYYKNRYYQLLWGKRKASVCIDLLYVL